MKLMKIFCILNPDYDDEDKVPTDSFYAGRLAKLLLADDLTKDTFIMSSTEKGSMVNAKQIADLMEIDFHTFNELWSGNPDRTSGGPKPKFSIPVAANLIMSKIHNYKIIVVAMNQRHAKPVLKCMAEHISSKTLICEGRFEVMLLDASGSVTKVSKVSFGKY